jgi:eukaryotic-like serine/threonine-protein kinase
MNPQIPPPSPFGSEEATAAAADPLVGELVGEFRVVGRIGSGMSGVVYEAWAASGAQVAIKVARADLAENPDWVERFNEDVRVITALRHPGIVQIHEVDRLPDRRPFVVMERIEGQTLETWIAHQEGPLAIGLVQSFGAQLAAALGAAHAEGIVHGDVNFKSVIVVRAKGGPLLKLIDFGISQVPKGAGLALEVGLPGFVGTPWVMAPEQIRAEKIAPRTDLYALGAVLYRLLTGVPPFDATNSVELAMQHLGEPASDPRQKRPDIPAPLAGLVLALLSKVPDDRPPTAQAVEKALRSAAEAGQGAAAARPLTGPVGGAPAARPSRPATAPVAGAPPARPRPLTGTTGAAPAARPGRPLTGPIGVAPAARPSRPATAPVGVSPLPAPRPPSSAPSRPPRTSQPNLPPVPLDAAQPPTRIDRPLGAGRPEPTVIVGAVATGFETALDDDSTAVIGKLLPPAPAAPPPPPPDEPSAVIDTTRSRTLDELLPPKAVVPAAFEDAGAPEKKGKDEKKEKKEKKAKPHGHGHQSTLSKWWPAIVVGLFVAGVAGFIATRPPKPKPADPTQAKPPEVTVGVNRQVAPKKPHGPLTPKGLIARAEALQTTMQKEAPQTTYDARVELRLLKRRAEAKPDAAEMEAIWDEMDGWESFYLHK